MILYLHEIVRICRKANIWETKLQENKSVLNFQCPLLNVLACGALAFYTAF